MWIMKLSRPPHSLDAFPAHHSSREARGAAVAQARPPNLAPDPPILEQKGPRMCRARQRMDSNFSLFVDDAASLRRG
jgi:hypothetical protein